MHGFVKGILVAACAGTAAVTIAACGSTPQQTPTANTLQLQNSTASPPTTSTSTGRHDIGDRDRDHDGDRDRDRGGDHDDAARSGAIGQVAPATISGREVRGTFVCNGQAVTISSSDAKITLTGTCASVSVTGSDDKVAIAGVGTISLSGQDDHVTWQDGPSAGAAPAVHDSGVANTVSHV